MTKRRTKRKILKQLKKDLQNAQKDSKIRWKQHTKLSKKPVRGDNGDKATRDINLKNCRTFAERADTKVAKISKVLSVVSSERFNWRCTKCDGKLFATRLLECHSVLCTKCAQQTECVE